MLDYKDIKSTSVVVKMRSSVSPKKREIIKIIKPKLKVNFGGFESPKVREKISKNPTDFYNLFPVCS